MALVEILSTSCSDDTRLEEDDRHWLTSLFLSLSLSLSCSLSLSRKPKPSLCSLERTEYIRIQLRLVKRAAQSVQSCVCVLIAYDSLYPTSVWGRVSVWVFVCLVFFLSFYASLCVCMFMFVHVHGCYTSCHSAWSPAGFCKITIGRGKSEMRCVCQCVCAMSVCKRINNSVLHYTLPLFNLKLGTDTNLLAYTHTRVHTNTHTAICLWNWNTETEFDHFWRYHRWIHTDEGETLY